MQSWNPSFHAVRGSQPLYNSRRHQLQRKQSGGQLRECPVWLSAAEGREVEGPASKLIGGRDSIALQLLDRVRRGRRVRRPRDVRWRKIRVQGGLLGEPV